MTLATIQHESWVVAVSPSPDGSKLATRSYDRTARLTGLRLRSKHFLRAKPGGAWSRLISAMPHTAEDVTVVVGGDTHKDTHTAAALDATGRHLATDTFPATAAGYRELLKWARSFGTSNMPASIGRQIGMPMGQPNTTVFIIDANCEPVFFAQVLQPIRERLFSLDSVR